MRLRTVVCRLAVGLALVVGKAGVVRAQATFYVPDPTTELLLAPAPCYVARVVDARPQHTSLGLVMRAGAPRLATFQASLPSTLQVFFKWHAPGQPGAVPLVMRLTGLEIAEIPGTVTEHALAGLVADFYAPQPDSSYRLVAHFAQAYSRPSLDATSLHATNLGHLLLEAAKVAGAQATWQTGGTPYTQATVLATQPLPSEVLPVLALAGPPRPGFYHSLPEFWHNAPSEAGPPQVERHPYLSAEWAGTEEVKPYRVEADGRRTLATDVWGFCDGERFYIRQGRNFYELTRRGAGFVHFGQLDDDSEFRRASGTRNFAKTLAIGWAAAGASAASGERRALFTFSLLTGKSSLNQASSAATAIAGRPTHLFIYRPRDAKGPAVRIKLAEGQPAQELAAGDFLTFEPSSDQPLRVCLLPAAGPATYLAVTPTSEVPIYLECRPATPEPLRKVDDKAGAAALNKLIK